ncbi:MAG: hypothetical protein K6F64_09970 [Clostridia bacterium]|nr:hypothetical protein [Clostridia bacterium]
MKVITHSLNEYERKSVVRFLLDYDTDYTEMSVKLGECFKQPSFVLNSSIGEHVLPSSVCKKTDSFIKATKDLLIKKIEIGESCGAGRISFTIYPQKSELICIGDSDFNFYQALTDAGFNIKL